jgi:hypothetical protein
MPANESDRFARHEKNSIATFEEYQAYLDKIGLEARNADRLRQIDMQDKLFDRYDIVP